MLHPDMDAEGQQLAHFRKSQKKFSTTADHSFSVLGHSKPYSFGRLNSNIIVILSSLGVTDATFLAKQQEYFEWIGAASWDTLKALDFFACLESFPLAERVLFEGVGSEPVKQEIKRMQSMEVLRSQTSHIMVHKSRVLYGVCDPFQVLQEGEVHIRITVPTNLGYTQSILGDVIIVRNPCLHPGMSLMFSKCRSEILDEFV
jgi:regulator of nonsense transcripts 1